MVKFDLKEKNKILVMTILLVSASVLTYYFHVVVGTGIIFTHLFYIPIILASLWWKRIGLLVAIFLATLLILSSFLIKDNVTILDDYLRAFMFVGIGFLVAVLSEKISKGEEEMQKAHKELERRVEERTAELSNSNVLLNREIIEHREAEKKLDAAYAFLQSIIDGVGEPIMVIGTDYRVKMMNRAASEFSLKSTSASGSLLCYQISHQSETPCSEAEHPCPLELVRKSGQTTLLVHEHFQTNRERRFIELLASPLYGADGTFQGIIESSRDITERKRTEEAIKKYARELEEANQLKDLFTDIIRHDLLNPVTVIKGFSEILFTDKSLREHRNSIEAIQKNVSRLEEMIQSAATLAKIEAVDKLDFEKRDLCEIVEKVISEFRPIFENKGMCVEFISEGKCLADVNPYLEDVFSNLLSNAIKYSKENTKIIVGIKRNVDSWIIYVKDRGDGIQDIYKEVIFDRFRRIEKRGVKGSGLGLSIVKRVVDLHMGKVWVEDNPEGGSIFSVNIPSKR